MPKVEILLIMSGRNFHDERSRYKWWQFEIFLVTGRDFHDDTSRFSMWRVDIFMMAVRAFYSERSDFLDDRSIFSWCQVEIFMITGQVLYDDSFHYDRSKFSSWQIMIFFLVCTYKPLLRLSAKLPGACILIK